MIFALCLLGAIVLFLLVAGLAVYFQIIRPMRQQIAELQAEQGPTSIRSREAKDNHLATRADLVILSKRVEELEIDFFNRPTYEVKS